MSKKTNKWVVIGGVVLVLTSYTYLYGIPKQKELKESRTYLESMVKIDDTASIEQEISDLKTKLTFVDTWLTNHKLKSDFPLNSKNLNARLGKFAEETGVTITSLEVKPYAVDTSIVHVPVALSMQGNYSDILRFLLKLESISDKHDDYSLSLKSLPLSMLGSSKQTKFKEFGWVNSNTATVSEVPPITNQNVEDGAVPEPRVVQMDVVIEFLVSDIPMEETLYSSPSGVQTEPGTSNNPEGGKVVNPSPFSDS